MAPERRILTDCGLGVATGANEAATPRQWRLWFAARLGPPRKVTVIVSGQRVRMKRRRLELPPGPNGSRGNPFGHAAWVKVWRQAGAQAAIAHRMPTLDRVRISATFHRRAIGTADEDNDRARCKPLVDGLRDAGVIANDTRGYVVYGDCTEERAGVDGPGILLIVEALAPAAGAEG